MLSAAEITAFQNQVWRYYRQAGRSMPWRDHPDPYWVVVSEIMLQQTQVSRVLDTFPRFIKRFPSFKALARAPLAAVLREWQGLGYNRRARYLKLLAEAVVDQHGGQLPQTYSQLIALPGIGPGTAGAILAYAFNQPTVFIETNIRTVYLHHFFADEEQVSDRQLLPYVEATLDRNRPREWFWALMDYGSTLKASGNTAARRSRHHTVQSRFQGSLRQLRGQVLRLLAEQEQNRRQLAGQLPDERLNQVLEQLEEEGLIDRRRSRYRLPV